METYPCFLFKQLLHKGIEHLWYVSFNTNVCLLVMGIVGVRINI